MATMQLPGPRLCAVVLVAAVLATACATSTYVVTEAAPAASSQTADLLSVPSAPLQLDPDEATVDIATALATVAPLPTVTPTPEPRRWVVITTSTPEPGEEQAEESTDSNSNPTDAQTANVGPSDYQVGRCYTKTGLETATPISCTEPHIAEALVVGQLWHGPEVEFPSKQALLDAIGETCKPVVDSYDLFNTFGMARFSFWPHPNDWRNGDRSYSCFIRFDQPVRKPLAAIAADQAVERARQEAVQQQAAEQAAAARQINIGDCTAADGLSKVGCDGPHTYVAFARTGLASAGGVYPGESLIVEQFSDACGRELKALGIQGNIFAIYPNKYDWENSGDRAVVCLVQMTKSQFTTATSG